MLSVVPLHNVHNMTIHRVYLKELTEAWPNKESQRLVEGICSCECAENTQARLMPILGVKNGKAKHLQVKALCLLETR